MPIESESINFSIAKARLVISFFINTLSPGVKGPMPLNTPPFLIRGGIKGLGHSPLS